MVEVDEVPHVYLKVVGSVAVTMEGKRLGKGSGYSEIEYGILREVGALEEDASIVTTVHELQIVEDVPQEPFDVSVDYIVTPMRVLRTEGPRSRPSGILWQFVDEEMLKVMPPLAKLKKLSSYIERPFKES